ncbi:peptide deformylase [Psychromarinibacter sp. C21-152]|uniref:Peptide deformylase n=1 Tax=Psychromarinibacter sediminicola TaxID=3033385 RepID=A0AAE3NP04_9RHOB|nr:peptide deformylase [Psychromarinibacter sediminicola]MDF0600853.1 peptide deformylase [Psychromarinibacter sediminicola]
MSRLPILVWGDPRLRAVARPVGEITPEVRDLAWDMVDTMYDAPGRGLAAPQVGVGLRMFVMDCHWKDGVARAPDIVIDPEILWRSEETAVHQEGCLSIPGVPAEIERPAEVTMRWTTLDGFREERQLDGFEAVCAQHEFDHLDGIMIPDRMSEEDRVATEAELRALAARGGMV